MGEAGEPTLPGDDDPALAQTRAALAPTLEATAAILPWVASPKPPRFDPKLSERWQETCKRLATAWSERYREGLEDFRPAVFALCGVALELADVDCLRLTEAFASASDRLDDPASLQDVRLVAAITAGIECLQEDGGLESDHFPQRAAHLAGRLEQCAAHAGTASPRSSTIDRLFVSEALELMDRINEALEMWPVDLYGAREASLALYQQAEPLELDGIANIALRLISLFSAPAGTTSQIDGEGLLDQARSLLAKLDLAVGEVLPES